VYAGGNSRPFCADLELVLSLTLKRVASSPIHEPALVPIDAHWARTLMSTAADQADLCFGFRLPVLVEPQDRVSSAALAIFETKGVLKRLKSHLGVSAPRLWEAQHRVSSLLRMYQAVYRNLLPAQRVTLKTASNAKHFTSELFGVRPARVGFGGRNGTKVSVFEWGMENPGKPGHRLLRLALRRAAARRGEACPLFAPAGGGAVSFDDAFGRAVKWVQSARLGGTGAS